MSEAKAAERASTLAVDGPIVNDFQIIVATVNGTGSQTSNTALIRALFRMGIPVNGKNIFPSNIKGLPTWYTIRVSKDGYVARHETNEVLVAMNEATIVKDVQDLPANGICVYDSSISYTPSRDDVTFYGVPVADLVTEQEVPRGLKEYVTNMVYVGVLAFVIGIEMEEIENALKVHFKGKEKPVKLNMDMVVHAYEWAEANLDCGSCRYAVERLDLTRGQILMEGNAAAALGAVFGGLSVMAWYPITPSSSVADHVMEYMSQLRLDPETGKATYAIVQAEDELAAIGMVLGAGWAGARAMTATSGPGLSLMGEFAGMAYFAEIPSVIWDIQRVGPSTGLPTRTSQGDLMFAYTLGHGDTQHIVLLPANPKEAFEFGWRALDFAERLQTLVMVLSDLDLGMNLWMSEPFDYPDQPLDRGKVLTAEDLKKLKGSWGRYLDVDGDGIPYRTIPGTDYPTAAYFTRGTGHDEHAVYSEAPDVWAHNLARIDRKFETARGLLPQPVIDDSAAADIGLVAFGTVDAAIVEGRDLLRSDGISTDYLRLRALPLSGAVREFIEKHDHVYVVENNHEGQLAKILYMEYPDLAPRVRSIAYLDGLPFTGPFVARSIREREA